MKIKRSGILLHISSLPSKYGIGDFGPDAFSFANFLANAKMGLWQILPLNPTSLKYGNSPYSSSSSFALNPLFISPDELVKQGLLVQSDIQSGLKLREDRTDYPAVVRFKKTILERAWFNFKNSADKYEFQRFCDKNAYWLDNYALFIVLRDVFDEKLWYEWPEEYRHRDKSALQKFEATHADDIQKEKFYQFIAYSQWFKLKSHCRNRGILIFGDLPIYVHYNSADVWTWPRNYKIDADGKPTVVSGVPPDYFSSTGQLWGNPVYDWDYLKKNGYKWWIQRFGMNFLLFDLIRIDHFRGLIGYWEVPAEHETAEHGYWQPVPYHDFFHTLYRLFPNMPIIAEDLGEITADVREFIQNADIPGMRVLQFGLASGDASNSFLPHNYDTECIVYTGTHDNNTIKGWFMNEINKQQRQHVYNYFGHKISRTNIHKEVIRLALMSAAQMVIVPMQDILGLNEKGRMNTPGTTQNNWEWRLLKRNLTPSLAKDLAFQNSIYGRG